MLSSQILCFSREASNAVFAYRIYFLREEEAIQLDGLNASQIRELREKSEKFAFQAEVNRMMKLIINSLYKNKEVSNMWLGSCYFVSMSLSTLVYFHSKCTCMIIASKWLVKFK